MIIIFVIIIIYQTRPKDRLFGGLSMPPYLPQTKKNDPRHFFVPSSSPYPMYWVLCSFDQSPFMDLLSIWSMAVAIRRSVKVHSGQGLHTYAIEQASTGGHRFDLAT